MQLSLIHCYTRPDSINLKSIIYFTLGLLVYLILFLSTLPKFF